MVCAYGANQSLFIYLFQTLGISYNTTLVLPSNDSGAPRLKRTEPVPNALQPSRQPGRALRKDGANYLSQKDYIGLRLRRKPRPTKNRYTARL